MSLDNSLAEITQNSYIKIELVHDDESDNDIRLYLADKFAHVRSKHYRDYRERLQHWPHKSDIDWLADRSTGYFIYASTVVKFIDNDMENPALQLKYILRRLNTEVSSESSPYEEIDKIYLNYTTVLTKASQDVCADVEAVIKLLAIYASNEPGLIEAQTNRSIAARAIQVNEDLIVRIHRRMRSIIVPIDAKSQHMGFLHKSFLDYLHDPTRSGPFCIEDIRYIPHSTHVLWNSNRYHAIKIGHITKWIVTSGCSTTLWPTQLKVIDSRIPLHQGIFITDTTQYFNYLTFQEKGSSLP
ncbi:hypothetical protein BDQ17DRAFT_1435194 [Cyathus striatus]|nr:hypothetical protein BDQ17DRAFT_1435194 [Cyathus striatus]